MTGPADRALAIPAELAESASEGSEARAHTANPPGVGRRRTRRDVLALILGTASLIVVERRAAYAQESSLIGTSGPAVVEDDAPPAETPAADAPPADAAPVEAIPAPPVSPTTYVVQSGDTLFSIAKKHGVSVDAVLWANNLSDANVLKQGQKLVIPPSTGKLHTVKDGDTIEALAQSYGVSKTGIATVNGLAEPVALKPGQRLLIPVAIKPASGDPAFTPAPLQAASTEEPVPIAPPDAGTGSPTPPSTTIIASMFSAPGIMTATGAPVVTVTNRKISKMAWPIPANPPKTGVSQKFRSGHTGIDIYAPQGTAIKAAAAGTVKMAEKNPEGFNGYGWIVIVDHGEGISTWYAHCGTFAVKTGDKVKAGDTLGTVGMTGRTTGPHLHFEVRINAAAINPEQVLT